MDRDGMMVVTRRLAGKTLRAEVQILDQGVAVLLTGGDRSHVGAIAWAEPGDKAALQIFPGHKDQFLAGPWAERLAEATGQRAAVICGIHYDGASQTLIADVLAVCDEMLREIVRSI